MLNTYKTDACVEGDHVSCSGSVSVFDTPDGPNDYLCQCRCHTPARKVPCPKCKGTGEVTSNQWTNKAERIRGGL